MHPLKKWRLDRNLTQTQGGEKVGISRVSFQRYENGERIPGLDDMVAICSRTGLEPNDFYPTTQIATTEVEAEARAGP